MNLDSLSSPVIAKEHLRDILSEVTPILLEHWEEIAYYKDIPLAPNYDIYSKFDSEGLITIYTIRVNNSLVGYAVYMVHQHFHYSSNIWAISDIILIRKPWRNLGLATKLFDFIEEDLRARGVSVVHTMTKLAHPELAVFLSSRGHDKVELCFSKRLGG